VHQREPLADHRHLIVEASAARGVLTPELLMDSAPVRQGPVTLPFGVRVLRVDPAEGDHVHVGREDHSARLTATVQDDAQTSRCRQRLAFGLVVSQR
jgi:hypothetical protein